MKAIVLVGGFGTRLRPLTLSTPKQMLPMGAATMLERVVRRLGQQGITTAVLSLGYKPDIFLEAYPDGRCGDVALEYAVEPEPLDTAGAIAFAADHAGIDDTFVAVNGDVLTDIRLDDLFTIHRSRKAAATIALTPVDDPSRYGVVPIDDQGRVEAFIEKPPPGEAPTNWINAGTYVLEPSVLDLVARGERVSIERQVFPGLVQSGSLFAVQCPGYWVDAGTPETYLQATLDYHNGRRGSEGGIDPRARIAHDAVVEDSVVGQGAVVGSGVRLTGSLVHAGARIEAGSIIADSVVGSRALVGANSRLTGLSVIGADAEVPSGTELDGGRLPAD
ncbi:MAG: NDP-sugar synthase [Actinomycetia bacterium]|nr:NDP-sugar synthase [Actinomycetes bacterium]